MTSGNLWREHKRTSARSNVTTLNQRTSARYDRCVASGGHKPSGDTVLRQFSGGPRDLPICSRCQVPYGAPKINWSSGTTVGRTR